MLRKALAATVMLFGLTASPVFALEQEIIVIPDERVGTSGVCGFPITVHRVGTLRIIRLTDDSGAEVREIEQYARYQFTFTNPATGQTLTGYSSGVHIFYNIVRTSDSLSFTAATNGGLVRVNAPGGGVIAGQMGHRVEQVTITAAGVSIALLHESGYFQPRSSICAYLS